MSGPARRLRRSCATNRGDRVLFGVAAVFTGSAAITTMDNLWCAIPASICTVFLVIAAVTGWCPVALLPIGRDERGANHFGFPEAPQRIDV